MASALGKISLLQGGRLESVGLLINGEVVVGGGRDLQDVYCPATGKQIAELTLASDQDIADAAEFSALGFQEWKSQTPYERSVILRRTATAMREHLEELAGLITREQGKTISEASQEIAGSADLFDWMAEEGKRVYGRIVSARNSNVEQFVLHEPVGPVAAFSPWNYPASLAARKISQALAAGCSIVIKPAEECPSIVLRIAQLCIESGVPAKAVQVLFGVPDKVSRQLIAAPQIQKITFTGSIPVGRQLGLLAGKALKPITLELGGHAPVIVMDDVDPAALAKAAVLSKFRNAGQICISPTRFYVHERIYGKVVDAFVAMSDALCVGDGMQAGVDMGPLAHARRPEAIQQLIDDAIRQGARRASQRCSVPDGGYFLPPTVLVDVPEDARAMQEEPFGPVALFSPFSSLSEVIQVANSGPHGLAAYAFTNSLFIAKKLQDEIKVGMLGLNTFGVTSPEMPLTGVKDSGLGSSHGIEGLLEHVDVKSVFRAS